MSSSSTSTANIGMSPTNRTELQFSDRPSSHIACHNKTHPHYPRALPLRTPFSTWPLRYKENVQKISWPYPGKCDFPVASSSAMRIIFSEYIAIQLVPSDWARRNPGGSSVFLSKAPMLSSPRKSAFKKIISVIIFTIYPPGEIEQEFMKDGFEKFPVYRSPREICCSPFIPARQPRPVPADLHHRNAHS